MRPMLLILMLAGAAFAAEPEEVVKSTDWTLNLGDVKIDYTATAGRMIARDRDGVEQARIFHVAYVKKPVTMVKPRPVTFVFNGGPGSSSVWLHMGGLGPRIVAMGSEGFGSRLGKKHFENTESWLGFTDLVFIDPVSTGYSRPGKGKKKSEFHGLREDANSIADFIRQWLTGNDRWTSPVFLAGESYGTTRAAEMSGRLKSIGVDLTGIVLVSPVLNFQASSESEGNDLAYWLYLPSLAATARYHGKVKSETSLPAFLDEVETFAETDYLLALAKGDRLEGKERTAMAERLAEYMGLSREYVLDANLRVDYSLFRKELLREELRTVGRLDSRFKGIDRRAVGGWPESDPSMDAIRGPFTAALNDYLARMLQYRTDLTYEIFGSVHPWNMGKNRARYVNVAETLRRTMASNGKLKVLCAMGYYDLATPYYAVEYTVSHMQLPPERRKNIRFSWYESGHMMYIRDADRVKLTTDASVFYEQALAGE